MGRIVLGSQCAASLIDSSDLSKGGGRGGICPLFCHEHIEDETIEFDTQAVEVRTSAYQITIREKVMCCSK